MKKCPYCKGTGKIAVLYSDLHDVSVSYEAAANKAGETHHYEPCEECNGSGRHPKVHSRSAIEKLAAETQIWEVTRHIEENWYNISEAYDLNVVKTGKLIQAYVYPVIKEDEWITDTSRSLCVYSSDGILPWPKWPGLAK